MSEHDGFVVQSAVAVLRQRSCQQEELAWFRVRDTLAGGNSGVPQNVTKALELACVCEHPHAVWLTKLFGGRDVNTTNEARHVFLGCENERRAVCFAALLRRDSIQGDEHEDTFASLLPFRRDVGQGTPEELFLEAAEFGCVYSMLKLARSYDKTDPQRVFWMARAAVMQIDTTRFLLREIEKRVEDFNFGFGKANVVFAIGRTLFGNVDTEKETVFHSYSMSYDYVRPVKQALQFYSYQLQCYRRAVYIWTIIGLRNSVVKDIRRMIGKMIWDAREEAMYSSV
jgi:hypothetical protein